MQIVIDIPEKYYKEIENTPFFKRNYEQDLILEGTPLPKGHGRLIDADKLNRIMYHKAFETDSDMQKWDSGCWIRYKMFENSMEKMSTIIKADAESEDKKDEKL